jgi:phosphotransferase system  glucose/maltose/N-acetylglucosamine-specific IIC component
MWFVGLLCVGFGVNGLIPIASYATWQMPLWLSVTLIIVGGLVFIFANTLTRALFRNRLPPHPRPEHQGQQPSTPSPSRPE